MTFKGKQVRVKIAPHAFDQYTHSAKQKVELLKGNPQYGIQIPKSFIPNKYVQTYDCKNLWKINLPDAHRMLYTIRGSSKEIIILILDILSHREYEELFEYNKS